MMMSTRRRRWAVPCRVPGSCAPQWYEWAVFSRWCDLQQYLSSDQGCDRRTGSGNTGPYTGASHSGTLQAGSHYDTAPHIIYLQFCKPTRVMMIISFPLWFLYLFQANSRVNHFFKVQNSCNQFGSKPAQKTPLCCYQRYNLINYCT